MPGKSCHQLKLWTRFDRVEINRTLAFVYSYSILKATMPSYARFGFLATAVVFHLVYVLSIFDIYFVSPVVSGMRLFGVERPPQAKAPADRLFLFVGTWVPKQVCQPVREP